MIALQPDPWPMRTTFRAVDSLDLVCPVVHSLDHVVPDVREQGGVLLVTTLGHHLWRILLSAR